LPDGDAGMLPLLCAAAFGPALADGPDGSARPRMGVLASVGASILAPLLEEATSHARSAHTPGDDQSRGPQQDLNRNLEREISRSIGEILAARDKRADELRSDIAMVMREIDAGGTVFRAAIEAGDEELQRDVLTARRRRLHHPRRPDRRRRADLARGPGGRRERDHDAPGRGSLGRGRSPSGRYDRTLGALARQSPREADVLIDALDPPGQPGDTSARNASLACPG
jgi:hypothetical protein